MCCGFRFTVQSLISSSECICKMFCTSNTPQKVKKVKTQSYTAASDFLCLKASAYT